MPMRPVLVVFDTRHGHSADIAKRVVARLRARGCEIDVEQTPGARSLVIGDFSAVIVIAPVYNRRHTPSIEHFVCQYARSLSVCPTAFISVSLGAASKRRFARQGVRRIASRLFQRSGWRPVHQLYVGGSLDYPVYEPAVGRWMRTVAYLFGLPTDTSRRHDLTSWNDVADIVDAIVDDVESESVDLCGFTLA